MKQVFIGGLLLVIFFSCRSKTESSRVINEFKLIIPDTTNNRRAYWDLEDINYRSQLEKQIGLSDLKKGTDSLEIRLWYSFSFSNSQELFVLKFLDNSCRISYFRVYPRTINYDDENRDREWNPYTDPVIDSSVSKTVLISKENYKNLHCDSIWFLKSQSELKIPDSIGFTDCSSYIIEIADKRRFKYLRHHCPTAYYGKIQLPEILSFLDFFDRITTLADKYHAIVPYKYD